MHNVSIQSASTLETTVNMGTEADTDKEKERNREAENTESI